MLVATAVVATLIVVDQRQRAHEETYRNRPLAAGLKYIGRDYNHPYVPFVGDVGPTTEIYYYATDVEPKSVVKLFPGWEVKEITRINRSLWNSQQSSDIHGYNLVNAKTGEQATYSHILDKDAVISASKLRPTEKKYIIRIWRSSYDTLYNSIN